MTAARITDHRLQLFGKTPVRLWRPTDWPTFTGQPVLIGSTSGRVNVYVDPTLGDAGQANALQLFADADRVVAFNDSIFKTGHGGIDVLVYALSGQTDGTGGADHMACNYRNGGRIEVCATFSGPRASSRISALFEAELSECSMKGNLCGLSTGEALSRWCAAAVSSNALSDFATAPVWDRFGRPNFVDVTMPTDGDAVSTGCGMAFLSWLRKSGCDLSSIARTLVSQGDAGTLASLYGSLMRKPAGQAWPMFKEALPPSITTDDPFRSGF